jgi:hypothetical protein
MNDRSECAALPPCWAAPMGACRQFHEELHGSLDRGAGAVEAALCALAIGIASPRDANLISPSGMQREPGAGRSGGCASPPSQSLGFGG